MLVIERVSSKAVVDEMGFGCLTVDEFLGERDSLGSKKTILYWNVGLEEYGSTGCLR